LILEARLEVTSIYEAFTEIETTVFLANAYIILDLNLEWLSFNSLEAVKSASSLLLGASSHVKSCDEALAIVNTTVLLADTNILGNLDSSLGTLALEAINRASCL
jgi:calcineurin-like phosphoesterase